MIFMIPGEIVALVTFPGVVMHEISHRLACDFLNVPVYGIQYFGLNKEASGYVLHEKTSLGKHWFISIAPLFFNTLCCIFFTFPFASKYYIGVQDFLPLDCLTGWIGFSMGYNAFPSNHDMKVVYEVAQEDDSFMSDNLYALYLLFKVLNALRRVYLSGIYAIGVSLLLPYMFFH